MNKSLIIRIILNSLLGLFFVFLWLQFVDFEETVHAIGTINPFLIIPTIGLFVLIIFLRSIRLKMLLGDKSIPIKSLTLVNFLSQFLSFIIPIRAGEIAKSVYLSTTYSIPLAKMVVIIFLDRFFDFWIVVALSLFLMVMLPTLLPPGVIQGLIVVLIFFTAGTLFIAFFPNVVKKIGLGISKVLITKKMQSIFLNLVNLAVEAVSIMRSGWRNIFMMLLLSLGAAMFEALVWYLLLSEFILNLDYPKVLLGSMLNALTFLIPAAPGYVGSAEAAGLAVFNLGLGMDKLGVSAATVAFHALTFVYMLIFGVGSLYLLKFNLNTVIKKIFKKDN